MATLATNKRRLKPVKSEAALRRAARSSDDNLDTIAATGSDPKSTRIVRTISLLPREQTDQLRTDQCLPRCVFLGLNLTLRSLKSVKTTRIASHLAPSNFAEPNFAQKLVGSMVRLFCLAA